MNFVREEQVHANKKRGNMMEHNNQSIRIANPSGGVEMNRNEEIETTLEKHRGEMRETKTEATPKIQQAEVFISKHLYKLELTVNMMIDECNIKRHNFSSKFEHYFGQKPKQYILHHRIAAAKKLLANPQLNDIDLSEMGYEVGFKNTSTFSKAFKRETGITPAHWRENHNGE